MRALVVYESMYGNTAAVASAIAEGLDDRHAEVTLRNVDDVVASEAGWADVLVFGGGVIPDADARALREQGVAEIFGPGASLKAIAAWLETALDGREDVG